MAEEHNEQSSFALGWLQIALTLYERKPLIRAIVQALPSIPAEYGGFSFGSSIDTLLASKGANIWRSRLEGFVENLAVRLDQVECKAIHRAFLDSTEFFDILVGSVRVAINTRSEEKRKQVANFLGGVISSAEVGDISEQVLTDLELLKDFHIILILKLPEAMVPNVLRKNEAAVKDMIIDPHLLREKANLDWGVFNKGWSDLVSRGFISTYSEATVWGGGSVDTYRPTKYLHIFKAAVDS